MHYIAPRHTALPDLFAWCYQVGLAQTTRRRASDRALERRREAALRWRGRGLDLGARVAFRGALKRGGDSDASVGDGVHGGIRRVAGKLQLVLVTRSYGNL